MISKIELSPDLKITSRENTTWTQGDETNNIYLYIPDETIQLVELFVTKPGGMINTDTVKFIKGIDEEGNSIWLAPNGIPSKLFQFTIYTGLTAQATFSFKLHSGINILDIKYKTTVNTIWTINKSDASITEDDETNETQQWRAIGSLSNDIVLQRNDFNDHLADNVPDEVTEEDPDVHGVREALDRLTIEVTQTSTAYTDQEVASAIEKTESYIDQEIDNLQTGVSEFTNIRILDTENNDNAYVTFNGKDVVFSYNGVDRELGKNIFLDVQPASGVTFSNGDVLQYAGSIGASGKVLAKPAVPAEINANPDLLLGVVTEVHDDGTATMNYIGEVNGLDTSAYTIGDILYFDSENVAAGLMTKVKPTAPHAVIAIGFVSRVNPEVGAIYVKMHEHFSLEDLSDVYVPVLNDHDVVRWNNSKKRFETYNTDLKADLSYVDDPVNGKADLVSGLVPSSQLPSYVDDVIEVDTYADLPNPGETGKLYIVISDETHGNDPSTYRWSGSVYVLINDQLSSFEVKQLYEANANTNAYTDAEKSKLGAFLSADHYYNKDEIDQLKAIYGWTDSVLADNISSSGAVLNSIWVGYTYIILSATNGTNTYTEIVRTSDLIAGDIFTVGAGTFTIGSSTSTFVYAGFTLDITGIKMSSEFIDDVHDLQELVDDVNSNINEMNPISNLEYKEIYVDSKYFKITGNHSKCNFLKKHHLFLNTDSTEKDIEIYPFYTLSEIVNGKTLIVGSKVIALYGYSVPSGAVWNAILLQSANYNNEIYKGQNCDYFVQYTGSVIQVMHVTSGGNQLAYQGNYNEIIRLDIPMKVIAIWGSSININNAIPLNENDCIETNVDDGVSYYVKTNDIVYIPSFDGSYISYKRYVDNFGLKSLERIKSISGYYSNGELKDDYVSFVSIYDVRFSTKVFITGYTFADYDYYVLLDENFNIINYVNNNTGNFVYWDNHEVDVSNAYYIAVSNNNNTSTIIANSIVGTEDSEYLIDKTNVKWNGKKVVWFGTSIPASGGYHNQSNSASYPIKLSRELGFECVNESIGGSCVHCKSPDRISVDNPYGFSTDFDLCAKCVTNTIEEMQWLIDNFNSPIFTINVHTSLSNAEKEEILSGSYENLLFKYLNGGSYGTPDLYVFNYGWNDTGLSLQEEIQMLTTYGEKNLYSYIGAMNFLLDIVYSNNPHTNVVIIGEIRENGIIEHEKYVANSWCIPYCDLKNKCGFSTHTITTTGYWQNNKWVDSGGSDQTLPIYMCWLQDGIHPHSSQDGRALNRITKYLVSFFINEIRLVE